MAKELERTGYPADLGHGELDLLAASAKARNVALWHVLTVERVLKLYIPANSAPFPGS